MKKTLAFIAAAFFFATVSMDLYAKGQTDAALTLIEPSSARAAGLGEAFVSMSDDISAMGYNPASLRTLTTGQASFLFQRGLSEDSSGKFLIGTPGKSTSLGLSVGYYNSGSINVFDGTTQRTVTGQRDLTVGLGVARNVGSATVGLTGKYLSSELGETASATTFAGDLGIQVPIHQNLRLGGAFQNLGGQMRYVSQSDDLPRLARLGFGWTTRPYSYFTTLAVEGVYHFNEHVVRPAIGLETLIGPMAFRMGYKSGSDLTQFSFGVGFLWGSSSLDYTFGLASEMSSSQMVSLSTRFGPHQTQNSLVEQNTNQPSAQQTPPVFEIKAAEGENPAARIYWVKDGDTLQSIAKTVYGRPEMSDDIYRANQHLLKDPEHLTPGQKILLPAATQ